MVMPDYLRDIGSCGGAAVGGKPMDFSELISRDYIDDSIRSRMRSAGYYRAGDSSLAIRLVGVAAASLERFAAAVRRWAREPGDGNVAPKCPALIRR